MSEFPTGCYKSAQTVTQIQTYLCIFPATHYHTFTGWVTILCITVQSMNPSGRYRPNIEAPYLMSREQKYSSNRWVSSTLCPYCLTTELVCRFWWIWIPTITPKLNKMGCHILPLTCPPPKPSVYVVDWQLKIQENPNMHAIWVSWILSGQVYLAVTCPDRQVRLKFLACTLQPQIFVVSLKM